MTVITPEKKAVKIPTDSKEQFNITLRRNRLYTKLSVISLIVAALVITAFFVYMMLSLGIIKIPKFLGRIFDNGSAEVTQSPPIDEKRMYDALPDFAVTAEYTTLELTDDEIFELLKSTVPLDEYTLENAIHFYSPEGETIYTNKVWKRGEQYRVERYNIDGVRVRRVVSDGERVNIVEYDGDTASSTDYDASPDFSMEHQSGMESVSDLRKRLFGDDDGGAENLRVTLVRGTDAAFYRVEYELPELGQSERADISLTLGLIISSESRDTATGELFYGMEMTSVAEGITGFSFGNVFNPDSAE